jgi:hypothetical protein
MVISLSKLQHILNKKLIAFIQYDIKTLNATMELVTESDIYEPRMLEDGTYADHLPTAAMFKHGIRCSCGTRKDHVFDTRSKFAIHIKSKTHQQWLADLNNNKTNYFIECIQLKELVNSQKIIIAHLEKELIAKNKDIALLTAQLNRDHSQEPFDLLTFD